MKENISQEEISEEIRIVNNITLTVPENRKYFNRVILIFVALTGLIGTVFSFFSMYKTDINMSFVLIFSLGVFTLFTVIHMLPRKVYYLLIPIALLWIYLLYKKFNEFENGFKILFNQIYENIYPNSSGYYLVTDKSPEHMEIFAAFAIFLIAFFICSSVYLQANFLFGFTFTFLVLETGLYFGKSPKLIFAFMLIIYWVSLAVLKLCGYYQKNSGKKSGFVRHNNMFTAKPGIRFYTAGFSVTAVAVICCIIFILTAVLSAITGYKRSEKLNTIRSDMKIAASEFSFDNLGESLERFSASLGFDKLKVYSHKLGNAGNISFKNTCELTIETDGAIDSNIYLKGYTGAVYSDNEWKDFTDLESYKNQSVTYDSFYDSVSQPQNMLTNYFLNRYDLYYVNMNITADYDKEKYNYIPYISVPYGKITCTDDTLMTLESKKSYSFQVNKLQINLSNLKDVLSGLDYSVNDDFDEYTGYVYSAYCNYENSEGLEEVYRRFVKGTVLESDADVYQKLIYIKELLEKNASYTLTPGRTPGNEDFVNYFLLDNHKGYCMHFATAGVILARMSGIPARYCDGYVLHADDFNSRNRREDGSYEIEIEDNRGHAWAEIYIENLGWIPFEFTGSGPALDEEETTQTAHTTTISTSEKKQTSKSKVSGISEFSRSTRRSHSVKNTESVSLSQSIDKKEFSLPFYVKLMLAVIILLITVVAVIALRHILTIKKKQNNLNHSDKITVVTSAYSYLLEILSFCNVSRENMQYLEFAEYAQSKVPEIIDDNFKEITQIVLKAQLSSNALSDNEVNNVVHYYNEIYSRVYNKSGLIRKIYIKFIKNL